MNISENDLLSSLSKAKDIMLKIMAEFNTLVRPGNRILDIAEKIEGEIESQGGMWAFPANICIGSIAAHYTPLLGEEKTVPDDEIIKIDFGVAINGYILDKAISLYFGEDDERKALVETAREALEKALAKIKVGTQYSDIAYEVYDFVKSRGFKVIENLHGHRLEQWRLHTEDEIPVHPEVKAKGVFGEGEVYAIEVFVTNGKGFAEAMDESRIYSLPSFLLDLKRIKLPIHLRAARDVFNWIWRKRKTLPFSLRHLRKAFDEPTVRVALAILEQYGLIVKYNVLTESQGSVAQAEETILVKKDGIEILTRPK